MSTASRSLVAALLIATGLAATNAANARQPPAAAAHAVAHQPNPGSGINGGEAARIRFQVQQHHQMQRRADADGSISRHEHAVLARDAAQVRHLIQTAREN